MATLPAEDGAAAPSLGEATRVWLRIGLLSFGGPAAQIALMHREIVADRGWLSERQYLDALSFCMLLPGPEAMQLATYAGWRLHGVLGGLIAGLLFVLPGAAVILALAAGYSALGDVPLVHALFYGIKAAVLVIVVEALLRVSRRTLTSQRHWVIAGLAFVGIFFLSVPYPVIVLAAGLYGWAAAATSDGEPTPVRPARVDPLATLGTILVWLVVWSLPFAAIWLLGAPAILTDIALFFSKLAVVTFGGAYAVLAYMAQDVVLRFGWLTANEMVDALGLAETTPGPLILVTEFVAFLAGHAEGGMPLAVAAACVALWVTFAPCFLWIFAGAPYLDWIASQPRLRGALKAITAAVVGVILNLSLWFGLHVLFAEVTRLTWGPVTLWRPEPGSVHWLAVGLFLICLFMAFRLHWGIIRLLVASSLLGTAGLFLL